MNDDKAFTLLGLWWLIINKYNILSCILLRFQISETRKSYMMALKKKKKKSMMICVSRC